MLRTNSLRFSYDDNREFLFPDIELNRGDECLLLGGSGSGKTTLLHLIGGLLRSQSGVININRTDITSLNESELDHFRGKHIGFIFQKNHLIPALSVTENLLMPNYLNRRTMDKHKIYHILDQLDLGDYADSQPQDLSHGQAQRVAIARAVVNEPDIILADEPTSALDDENCSRVIELLLKMKKLHHSILLIATHDQRLKSVIHKQISI